ncbi:ABC transporter permease [Candidatus Woesearchaeota archaeon]|nr:ABC transporter permease [Candidatus Woesearchaeota archaeon]
MKFHRIKGLLWNYYYFSLNSLDRIFDVFYWPIVDILIWGFMTTYIKGISDFNIVNLILGGLILWVFLWRSSQDIVTYLLEHYWSRSLYHLFVTPVSSMEMITALAIMGIFRSMISFVVLSIFAYLFYQFNIFSVNPFHFMLFVSLLTLFAWGLGLLVSSLVFRWGSRIQVLAWSTIWILQPFSCVFYPLSTLPPWAMKIASLLPTTYVFEGLRASLTGEPVVYSQLLFAFILVIIFLMVVSLFLIKSIDSAKKKGSFAKPE